MVARLQALGQLHITSPDEPDEDFLPKTEEALAAFGLQQVGDVQKPRPCCLWPCNVAAFNVWQRLQTQWRFSAAGDKTGLDYAAVTSYLRDVVGTKPKDRASLFGQLQAMEFAALKAWGEQAKHK